MNFKEPICKHIPFENKTRGKNFEQETDPISLDLIFMASHVATIQFYLSTLFRMQGAPLSSVLTTGSGRWLI